MIRLEKETVRELGQRQGLWGHPMYYFVVQDSFLGEITLKLRLRKDSMSCEGGRKRV